MYQTFAQGIVDCVPIWTIQIVCICMVVYNKALKHRNKGITSSVVVTLNAQDKDPNVTC